MKPPSRPSKQAGRPTRQCPSAGFGWESSRSPSRRWIRTPRAGEWTGPRRRPLGGLSARHRRALPRDESTTPSAGQTPPASPRFPSDGRPLAIGYAEHSPMFLVCPPGATPSLLSRGRRDSVLGPPSPRAHKPSCTRQDRVASPQHRHQLILVRLLAQPLQEPRPVPLPWHCLLRVNTHHFPQ